jgi:DNA-binding NarL/FixJ family response regulator
VNRPVKLLNIGFGNVVLADRVVAIVNPSSAPMKRLREEARVAGKLVGRRGSAQPERSPLHAPARTAAIENDLTERELEVLRLIGTGATNREIADRLVVSEGTVKNHVSSILSRLGLRDRTQAALFAHEHGLT